jgi:hypothetical protein
MNMSLVGVVDHLDLGPVGSLAHLAVQQRLGLLSFWRYRAGTVILVVLLFTGRI